MDTINVINRPGDRLPKRCLITSIPHLVLVILYHILILKGTNSLMLMPIDFSQFKVGDTLYQFKKITDYNFLTKQTTVRFRIKPVIITKLTNSRVYTNDNQVYKYRKTMFLPDASNDKYFSATTTEIRLYPSKDHAQAAIDEWHRIQIHLITDKIKKIEHTANTELRNIQDHMKQQPSITQENTDDLVELNQRLANALNLLDY